MCRIFMIHSTVEWQCLIQQFSFSTRLLCGVCEYLTLQELSLDTPNSFYISQGIWGALMDLYTGDSECAGIERVQEDPPLSYYSGPWWSLHSELKYAMGTDKNKWIQKSLGSSFRNIMVSLWPETGHFLASFWHWTLVCYIAFHWTSLLFPRSYWEHGALARVRKIWTLGTESKV